MFCSKFNYLKQEPVFSGRKTRGPDGDPEGGPEGPQMGSRWGPKDHLSNRFQRVTLGDTLSNWKSISNAVPQGSILGPLLPSIASTRERTRAKLQKLQKSN